MIKNKEEILKAMRTKFDKVAEELINSMDTGSNNSKFGIDEIEEIGEKAQKEALNIILEEINNTVNNINEENQILLKKRDFGRKEH